MIFSNSNGGMISAQLTIAIITCYGNLVSSQTITSRVPIGGRVCPGQEISFMCVTQDSPIIAWGSREYIDVGSLLEFAIFNNPGDKRISPINHDTVATLVNRNTEDGVQILSSVLRIVASAQFSTFSISCFHGNGTKSSITVFLQDEPNVPQDIVVNQRTERYMGNCIINIGWRPPTNIDQDDITHYMIYINGTNTFNETNDVNQNLMVISYSMCNCSTYQIRVSAVDRCGRQGQSTPTILLDQGPFSLPEYGCELVSTTQATSPDAGSMATNAALVVATIFATITLLVIIMFAAMIPLLMIVYIKCKNRSFL